MNRSSRKRVPVSDYLIDHLQAIVDSRRKRGAIATLTSVASEILADCLPHYQAREEAIARGELVCKQHQLLSATVAAELENKRPTVTEGVKNPPTAPAIVTPQTSEAKPKSSKRGQLNAFFNS